MARNVDWSDPSDDDLRWAVEWERWREIEEAGFDLDEVGERYGVTPPNVEDRFRTSGVPRVGSDNEMRLNRRTGRPETMRQDDGGEGIVDDETGEEVVPEDVNLDDMPDDYNDWKVPQLRAELKNRQLPADGNKDDLVLRLVEDDESADE